MAVVFRALDEKLGRRVALKILAPALAADPGFRQRFIRESRAAAAIDDPHIIPLFEAGESDGVLFIAMRYVQGGDVRSLLARDGAIGADRVAAIVAPLASALDAAHAAGLVHRDVKPANMLLDARPGRPDHVYLSDFGLSKEAAASGGLTGTGLFLGTVDYAAPEQIDGRQVDGRTDQYALACAAFEMLCGQPPFRRDQGLAVLHAHLSTTPPQLSAMRADVPPATDVVLGRALAKSPEDRFPTCGEFSDALRAALGIAPYDAGSGRASQPRTDLASASPPLAGAGTDLTVDAPFPLAGLAGAAADGPGGWQAGFAGPGAVPAAVPGPVPVPGFPPGAAVPGPPAWQAQPGWPPDQPGWMPGGPPGRRPAARWPFVLMIAAVAAAVVTVTIFVTTRLDGASSATAARGSTPAAGSLTPTAGSTRSATPTVSATPAATPTSSAGLAWVTYQDPAGWAVELPAGWAVDSATRTGTYPGVDFTGPAPGFHLFISWSTKTGTRALPAWQRQAASFARSDPTYQLIELSQVSYRSYNSAVWEFADVRDGVPTQDIDLGFVVKPGIEGYAIELYGPQSDWSSVYGSMWSRVLATFEPAP